MIDAGIAESVAASVSATLAVQPQSDEPFLQAALKAAFPELRLTVCSDDDIPPLQKPAVSNGQCAIYYLDASEHCVRLTNIREVASGLVVGLIRDND